MTAGPSRKRRFHAAVFRPLRAFLALEAASSGLLVLAAVVAVAWANLHPASHHAAFDRPLFLGIGVRDVLDEGLMTLFFLVVGMEIKRELVGGELSSLRKASLPAVAALGGMILPALLFYACNVNGAGRRGWGIPMATDLAFAIGILGLVKDRVPRALVVFLTALAIFDDIGGILVIAIFYGRALDLVSLAAALVLVFVLVASSRAGVRSALVYASLGAALAYALHRGGIHATLAGVVLGLILPATRKSAPDGGLAHALHLAVAFVIVPAFALANAGVSLRGVGPATLVAPVALGTMLGLVVGKTVGVLGLTLLAVKLRLAPMPGDASVLQLLGVSIVAGVGFTVALFIAVLAFPDAPALLAQAKLGIVAASIVAGLVGYAVIRATPSRPPR